MGGWGVGAEEGVGILDWRFLICDLRQRVPALSGIDRHRPILAN